MQQAKAHARIANLITGSVKLLVIDSKFVMKGKLLFFDHSNFSPQGCNFTLAKMSKHVLQDSKYQATQRF